MIWFGRSLAVGLTLSICSTVAAESPSCRETRALPGDSRHLCLTTIGNLDSWVVWAEGDEVEPMAGVLVMLHGYGSNQGTLLKLIRTFARRHRNTLIFPRAIRKLPRGGRIWWPAPPSVFRGTPAHDEEPEPPGMRAARQHIMELLADLETHLGIDSQRVVLAGFSQGATLAVNVAVARSTAGEPPLAGVVSMSGRFLSTHAWRADLGELVATPLLLTHGRRDSISPYWAANSLQQSLRDAGAAVAWLPHGGGHRPSAAVSRQFHASLADRLTRNN